MPYPGHPHYIFKICLLGQGAVGKTCICRRLCLNTFDSDTKMTIGINFYTHDIPMIIDGKEKHVRLSIWDFGGQEQFKKLFQYYINGVNGVFMCFSLVNFQSLLNLDWWYQNLKNYIQEDIPKVVLGTKSDIVDEDSNLVKINDLIIEQFLLKHKEEDFLKTSSKEDYNINESFKFLTKKILDWTKLNYETVL